MWASERQRALPRAASLVPLMVLAHALPGCAVVTVVGATAGTAISITGAVVSTGVKVTGKVIEKTIDAVTPDTKPDPRPAAP